VDQLPDTMRILQLAFREMHDRDALMRFAFKRLKTFPHAAIDKFRAEVAADTKQEQAAAAERMRAAAGKKKKK
jgi:hypothetical protein